MILELRKEDYMGYKLKNIMYAWLEVVEYILHIDLIKKNISNIDIYIYIIIFYIMKKIENLENSIKDIKKSNFENNKFDLSSCLSDCITDSLKLPDRYTHLHSGKVRETYQHPDDKNLLIMIATDRISTHDVVHYGLIPSKGEALTQISRFWFGTIDFLDTHMIADPERPSDFPDKLKNRTEIVKKLNPLPIEAIVRGYLYGSALKGYDSQTGKLSTSEFIGKGLQKCSKFNKAIFTPSTKSDEGDININYDNMEDYLYNFLLKEGFDNIDATELSEQIKKISINIYEKANKLANENGVVIGDTKFEFGLDSKGKLYLIDEILTPDSSRFWKIEGFVQGQEPESLDKQVIRDYVMEFWKKNPDKKGKPVVLPDNIIEKGGQNYKTIKELFYK
ncbi:phosphoribosylaminoimidazole-succinocarboxamide synthase [Candidatus Vampirococcus lugosii]|uniref:Phosphoribosylaminoimidazole-succinocarboxamide synthase n=2 Tax=Candidatus Vampirococcus lugosii TaxID=2789015 RepID=A0ABS5QLG2_9BACT|nr:phosphoribosylaminoimidazole-succinocarboxamide synthase [Candidatus Vampirococcus lugosii]